MTLVIDTSKAARAVREGLLRPRTIEPRGIVIHTTGAGPWTRWNKDPDKFADPFDAAVYVYERISKYSGHYVVCGDTGEVARMVHPMTTAWHVGSKGSWRYKLPKRAWASNKGLGWWFTRFPGCDSPRDLLDGALWRMGSANALTIGIEVAPPKEGPRAEWSPQTWTSLRRLTAHLGRKYGIPLDRYHVFSHSDAHPLARSTKAGAPWDPSPRQYRIGQAVQELRLFH